MHLLAAAQGIEALGPVLLTWQAPLAFGCCSVEEALKYNPLLTSLHKALNVSCSRDELQLEMPYRGVAAVAAAAIAAQALIRALMMSAVSSWLRVPNLFHRTSLRAGHLLLSSLHALAL